MRTIRSLLIAAAIAAAPAAQAAGPLTYIGQQIVDTNATVFGTRIGGLSGIDFDATTGRYFAISDDRAGINLARFYEVSLDLNQFVRSNAPGAAGVTFNAMTVIRRPDGSDFAVNTLDPEAIRLLRGGVSAPSFYWVSEGERLAGNLQNPFVREMTLSGMHVRELSTPAHFNPAGAGSADAGIRRNLAFESLAFSTDRALVYAAVENALVQDGPAADLTRSSPARVVKYDVASGNAVAEYVYNVDPVASAPIPAGSFATNGLVELLAVGPGQFIAVERSFSNGVGNAIRLYLASLAGATDVSGLTSLAGQAYTAMSKTLLLDLGTLRNDDGSPLVLDNIEGITFGPSHAGMPTLILVSDSNFSPTQFTQFIALGVAAPIPEPHTWALMLAGLGLAVVGARARARRLA